MGTDRSRLRDFVWIHCVRNAGEHGNLQADQLASTALAVGKIVMDKKNSSEKIKLMLFDDTSTIESVGAK